MSRLHKLWALPARKRTLLLQAFFWLAVMRVAILLLPFQRVAALMGLRARSVPDMNAPAVPEDADTIGWAVRTAAARTPWQSTCLVQALAGIAMLRRHRLPGTLYLGVAKDEAARNQLLAHAWLSCGERVLTGEAESRQFAVLSAFTSG